MKATIENNSKAASVPRNPIRQSQADRFMSELVHRQQVIEAEFRNFSASMVRSKTMEVIS